MNNYDPINTGDPQLDFDTQQQILVNALKQAQALQQPQFRAHQGNSKFVAPYQPGADLGNVFNRVAGQMDQRMVQQDQNRLNREEGRRFDQGMSDLTRINPEIDYNDPAQLAGDNANRMNAAGQMIRLPLARKFAEQAMGKMSTFGDTIATLKMKQLDAAERQAERIQRDKELAELKTNAMIQVAGLNNSTKRDIADDKLNALPKDLYVNENTGQVEARPGTETFRKREEKVAGLDKAHDTVTTSLDGFIKDLGELESHAGLDRMTGKLFNKFEDWDSDTIAARAKFNQIKAKSLMSTIEALRAGSATGSTGMGQLSNKEGQYLIDAFSALDPNMEYGDFKKELGAIKNRLMTTRSQMSQHYIQDKAATQALSSTSGRVTTPAAPPPTGGLPNSAGRLGDAAPEGATVNAKGQTIVPPWKPSAADPGLVDPAPAAPAVDPRGLKTSKPDGQYTLGGRKLIVKDGFGKYVDEVR